MGKGRSDSQVPNQTAFVDMRELLHRWPVSGQLSIGSQKGPQIGVQKGPQGTSFCSVQRCHPSAPAHATAEPSRGAAVKNGRFASGRPQGLFLRAVSTAA